MKPYSIFPVLCYLILQSFETKAQAVTNLTIQFPQNLNAKNISVLIDDGKENHKIIGSTIQNNQIKVTEKFYSKYATIIISYRTEKSYFSTLFWVSGKPAKIQFTKQQPADNPFQKYSSSNAQEVSTLEEAKKLDTFIAAENTELQDFYTKNPNWPEKDSLIMLMEAKTKKMYDRKIEFVRQNGDIYYSFWLFRTELAYTEYNIDSLTNIYSTVFPVNFKNSTEGKEVVKVLNGRSLKKGKIAPDFILKDITGKTISLKGNQGKYVLLNFWASWCEPCIAEFPAIKQLRANYKSDKLEIISINSDSELPKCMAAIKKHEMNWTHISRNNDLLKTYAVIGIPVVYLIDPKGEIIFSRDEEKDFKLELLSKILAEKLKSQ
jgi:thiol-disulfide isomerase/thioredoxin